MLKENFTLTLKRPRQEVFDALTDVDRFAQLAAGKVAMEKVPGKPASGLGSVVVIKSGTPAIGDVTAEVMEWDPPKKCTRRFDVPDLPTTVALAFEEVPEGTLVTVDFQMEAKSVLYKMMLPMLERKLKADKDKALAQLQAELDQGPSA